MLRGDSQEVPIVAAGCIALFTIGGDRPDKVVGNRRTGGFRFDLEEGAEVPERVILGALRVGRSGLGVPERHGSGHPMGVRAKRTARSRVQVPVQVGSRRFVVSGFVVELSQKEVRLADLGRFGGHHQKSRLGALPVALFQKGYPQEKRDLGIRGIRLCGVAQEREAPGTVSGANPRERRTADGNPDLLGQLRLPFRLRFGGGYERFKCRGGLGPFLSLLMGKAEEVIDAVGVGKRLDRGRTPSDRGVPVGRLGGRLALARGFGAVLER